MGLLGLATVLVLGVSAPLSASIVTVNGNMNIFGAGHPAPPFNGLPGTEGVIPVLALSGLNAGHAVTFPTVTGSVTCGSTLGTPCQTFGAIPADGGFIVGGGGTNINALAGSNVGISGITFTGRQMFLVGVFIGDTEPTGSGPAQIASYTSTIADTTTTFNPLLYQSFYIGDGRTGFNNAGGTVQQYIVPTGGTRLYLGFMDAFNSFVGFPGAYNDDMGSLSVDAEVAPEPGTIMLMGLGLAGVVLFRKKLVRS
jgi:hypothetical protein